MEGRKDGGREAWRRIEGGKEGRKEVRRIRGEMWSTLLQWTVTGGRQMDWRIITRASLNIEASESAGAPCSHREQKREEERHRENKRKKLETRKEREKGVRKPVSTFLSLRWPHLSMSDPKYLPGVEPIRYTLRKRRQKNNMRGMKRKSEKRKREKMRRWRKMRLTTEKMCQAASWVHITHLVLAVTIGQCMFLTQGPCLTWSLIGHASWSSAANQRVQGHDRPTGTPVGHVWTWWVTLPMSLGSQPVTVDRGGSSTSWHQDTETLYMKMMVKIMSVIKT